MISIALLLSSKETDVELNSETTNRVLMPLEPNAGENKKTKSGNKPLKIVVRFKYLGTTIKHQNCIHDS